MAAHARCPPVATTGPGSECGVDPSRRAVDTDPTPIADPPGTSGAEAIASTWDDESRPVLDRVADGYGLTPAESQKFGTVLLTFFVGLDRG